MTKSKDFKEFIKTVNGINKLKSGVLIPPPEKKSRGEIPTSIYEDKIFTPVKDENPYKGEPSMVGKAFNKEKDKKVNYQTNDVIAQHFIEKFNFYNIEGTLYLWDNITGLYKLLTNEVADRFIRLNTPVDYKYKINKNVISEILQWIKADLPESTFEKLISNNHSYIPLLNGVFNLEKFKLNDYRPTNFFTSSINAYFDPNDTYTGFYFEKFLSDITNGDENLYLRIQELFGYVISEVRNLKYIPFLVGPKDTGKSIVLNLLEQLIGKDSYTNLSFEQLNQPEYLAQLIGKKLNSCAEASEFKLSRLDVFKKLSGGDTLIARPIYGHPISFVNTAVLLFAGNHLPKLKSIDRSNAFSQRLVIFPFLNQIAKKKQDPYLIDKLLSEKSYIIKWAIKGLLRWQEQNYIFTDANGIEELQRYYESSNNSIESFISNQCLFDSGSRIHKLDLYEYYKKYCEENDLLVEKISELHNYLLTYKNITHKRFRLNGNNSNGYIGINLNFQN